MQCHVLCEFNINTINVKIYERRKKNIQWGKNTNVCNQHNTILHVKGDMCQRFFLSSTQKLVSVGCIEV